MSADVLAENEHERCVEGGDCENKARFHCKLCEGDFCWKHFQETHPNGRCIHY